MIFEYFGYLGTSPGGLGAHFEPKARILVILERFPGQNLVPFWLLFWLFLDAFGSTRVLSENLKNFGFSNRIRMSTRLKAKANTNWGLNLGAPHTLSQVPLVLFSLAFCQSAHAPSASPIFDLSTPLIA